MAKSYYNTTHLVGHALRERIDNAASQEQKVKAFFEAHADKSFTPFEVQDAVFENTPITSVRRAITNLTDRGVLDKTNERREGDFGELNYLWTLSQRDASDSEPEFPPDVGPGDTLSLFGST